MPKSSSRPGCATTAERPKKGLGGLTPAAYAQRLTATTKTANFNYLGGYVAWPCAGGGGTCRMARPKR